MERMCILSRIAWILQISAAFGIFQKYRRFVREERRNKIIKLTRSDERMKLLDLMLMEIFVRCSVIEFILQKNWQ